MTAPSRQDVRSPSTGWGALAACTVSGVDGSVFDASPGTGQVRLALFLCSVCPVRAECAAAARSEAADGVIRAGALWEEGRAAELSGALPPHGTRTCYRRGCRCLPCMDAELSYRRGLSARPARSAGSARPAPAEEPSRLPSG